MTLFDMEAIIAANKVIFDMSSSPNLCMCYLNDVVSHRGIYRSALMCLKNFPAQPKIELLITTGNTIGNTGFK